MAGMSPSQIAEREASMIRSKERSKEICSLLTAFKLFDTIASVENMVSPLVPPIHPKIPGDFQKNIVRLCSHLVFLCANYGLQNKLHSLEDWTSILKKFRKHNRRNQQTPGCPILNTHGQNLQALFNLQSGLAGTKSLYNLQLAATHLCFMLNHESTEMVRAHFYFWLDN